MVILKLIVIESEDVAKVSPAGISGEGVLIVEADQEWL